MHTPPTLISVVLFFLLGTRAVHAKFSVQTPMFTQCGLTQFSWDQTKGPYNVIIVNQTDPCGEEVTDLGDHNSTSLSWNVTLPSSWNVMISIEDAEGEEAWSGPITVQPSNNASCLSANNLASPQSSSSPQPSSTSGSGSSAGVGGSSHALSVHRIPPVPTVLLGIIGLAFVLAAH
ncbi:hypothetical protein EDB86DRAFT_90132 [Lactarius hatsudake]|nr:hypothetical protein EDB86DRAFT_90132 [Lactarius hatsudake]